MLRMADVELTSVDWLWFPYIPFGKLTIIQGNPGEGKTYFAMRLAAACTNRKPLPGMETLEPFNIIYQTAEDGLGDTVKPRLMEADADLERVLVIDDRDIPLTLADERIARAIRENNARLVIIDPVQAFLGADVDMNRANEVRPIFGKVGTVIVKDMSRLGRNYLQVGFYTEMLFPQKGVRFIAVNDNVDSASEGMDNDFTPLRNLFNEWLVRDTSKKIKAVKKSKGMSGKPVTSKPVYGYVMDEDENFIIDEEAAPVVQQIYQLCLAGNGPTKIARMLTEQQIPTPGTLEYQRTGSTRRYHPGYECKWATNTVVHILENREYTGCLVNFKTEKPSYKVKHSIENPVEKQAIFENHHEPIIDKETWERVQELRKQRKRPNRYDEVGLFSGILFCADCGHVLYQQRYQNKDRKQDCYICGSYKKRTRNCTAHFIRTDLLTAGVLANLRQVTEYAAKHESRFVKLLVQQNEIGGKRKTAAAIKQLEQAQERISEISRIIKRLYEDNVNGKISDERFMELSADYEAEQAELKKRAAALQAELDKSQAATVNAEKFMGIVRKHLAFEELTPTLLREMIEKIVVHECSYDENGTRRQDIEIYYSFVGKIDLPE